MGSVSGRSGRAWTPLQVGLRGASLRGAAPLGPGCNITPPLLLRAIALVPQMRVRNVPLRASPDYMLCLAASGEGGGGVGMSLFCWVFCGHPLNGTPQRALLTVIRAATTLVPRGACGLHAVGGGVAFAPPASGWVRCSLRPPMLGWPVEVLLAVVGIALGPLAGVGQVCHGWGALLRARPFSLFTLLCALLSACSLLCLQLCLLHHSSLDPLSF